MIQSPLQWTLQPHPEVHGFWFQYMTYILNMSISGITTQGGRRGQFTTQSRHFNALLHPAEFLRSVSSLVGLIPLKLLFDPEEFKRHVSGGRGGASTHRWSWRCGCTWAVSSLLPGPSRGRCRSSPGTGPSACCGGRGPWRTRRRSQTGPSPPAHTWNRCRYAPDLRDRQTDRQTDRIKDPQQPTLTSPTLYNSELLNSIKLSCHTFTQQL